MGNSHKNHLVWNQLLNQNQTLIEQSLDCPLPKLCPAIVLSHQDGRHSAVALLLKAALIQVSDYRILGASGFYEYYNINKARNSPPICWLLYIMKLHLVDFSVESHFLAVTAAVVVFEYIFPFIQHVRSPSDRNLLLNSHNFVLFSCVFKFTGPEVSSIVLGEVIFSRTFFKGM